MSHSNESGTNSETLIAGIDEAKAEDEYVRILRQKTHYVTVEPMIFLFIVSVGCVGITVQSFIVDILTTTMAPGLNCSSVNCENKTEDKKQHEEIQSVAAKYFMARSLFETFFQIFYAMFLEGWLEKQGCKSTMLLPLFGSFASSLSLLVLSVTDVIAHPVLVVFTSLPYGLTGGTLAVSISVNTFMTRITTAKNRSVRLGIVESFLFLGFPTGIQLGAQVLKYGGFSAVFAVCAGLQALAVISCTLLVPNDKEKMLPSLSTLPEIFNLGNIKRTSKILTHLIHGAKPLWIIALFIILGLRATLLSASINWLLYTNLMFDWTPFQYSNFVTADGLLQFIGIGLIAVLGMKILKLRDATLGILGALSYVGGCFMWAFPICGDWTMYIGSAIGMFSGSGNVLARSSVSKLVDPAHVGKVFVLIGIIETVMLLGGSSLFGLIYSETVTFAPNSIFFVGAAISSIVFIAFLYLKLVIPRLNTGIEGQLIITEEEPTVQT